MRGLLRVNKEDKTELTSGEVSHLWTTYYFESLQKCGVRFFLQHVDDEKIKELLEGMLKLSDKRIKQVTKIFTKEGYPLPRGFTDGDLNLKAPRLFSDILYINYSMETLKMELTTYSLPMLAAVKPEIQDFYYEVMQDTQQIE